MAGGLTVRFRVDFGGGCSVGIGKIELLEGIARSGSLSKAARAMRMSYRRAWLLLEDMNVSFDQPVAHATVGGPRRRRGWCSRRSAPAWSPDTAGWNRAYNRWPRLPSTTLPGISRHRAPSGASSPHPSNESRTAPDSSRRRDAILDEGCSFRTHQFFRSGVLEAGGALGVPGGRVRGCRRGRPCTGRRCSGRCRGRGRAARCRAGRGRRRNPRQRAMRQ